MSAYAIFDNVAVRDLETLEEYKRRVPAVVQQFGGRYVVLGGETRVVEGDWRPRFLVMLEFPTFERATAWYESPEYRTLKALRLSSVQSNGILVNGLETSA
jgi:uncharacterized protein (DUF1330 family)